MSFSPRGINQPERLIFASPVSGIELIGASATTITYGMIPFIERANEGQLGVHIGRIIECYRSRVWVQPLGSTGDGILPVGIYEGVYLQYVVNDDSELFDNDKAIRGIVLDYANDLRAAIAHSRAVAA